MTATTVHDMDKTKQVIVYITRDIERALGMEPCQTYRIISNETAYAKKIKEKYPDFVTLVAEKFDTAQLMETAETTKVLSDLKETGVEVSILVFKNTERIETIAKEKGWTLLNPSAALAERIENKITQIEWLGELIKYLPTHSIQPAKDIIWKKEPLIIQWAHGHTGDGTILVNSAEELDVIKKQFPERAARVTPFLTGPSFTMNVIARPSSASATSGSDREESHVLLGNISYQITGIPPFTDNSFSTVGNDWSLTHSLLNEAEIAYIQDMAREIGEKMSADDWAGLFGIDVTYDVERNKIHLIEINARQPASATFESTLQNKFRDHGVPGQTVIEAHLAAVSASRKVTGQHDIADPSVPAIVAINDGSQIVQRITRATKSINPEVLHKLSEHNYAISSYDNTKSNADLLRIQSSLGIMEAHGKLNKRGKEILAILTS